VLWCRYIKFAGVMLTQAGPETFGHFLSVPFDHWLETYTQLKPIVNETMSKWANLFLALPHQHEFLRCHVISGLEPVEINSACLI